MKSRSYKRNRNYMKGSVGVPTQMVKLRKADLMKRKRYLASLHKHPRKKILSSFNGEYTK